MIDLRPVKKILDEKPIAVVGLGASGLAVLAACRKAGIETIAWDDDAKKRAAAEEYAPEKKEPTAAQIKSCAFLCLAPGIPFTHPVPHELVKKAQAANIPVIGDIEIFHLARPDVKTIGITGTNGKSTTTALLGHILKTADLPVAVGGNIGLPVLALEDLPAPATYILELSSYQLDLLGTFTPTISVLLNLGPDHLDRHGGMEGYIAAKEKIFKGHGTAIIGVDDPWTEKLYTRQNAKRHRKMIAVSCKRPIIHGVYVSTEGMLFDGKEKILNLGGCPTLRGRHNWQNAAAAYAAASEAGVSKKVIHRALQSFPGLAHRQRLVASIGGVDYINDSKATNDQAAATALETFGAIYWIAGGLSKGAGYKFCEKHLPHVRHAFLIGTAEAEMAEWLKKKNTPFTRCGDMDAAVRAAHKMAQLEHIDRAVVLLSPACASFDQFENFGARGDYFSERVKALMPKIPAQPVKKGGAT